MNTSMSLLAMLSLLFMSVANPALAQTRRPVRSGNVTGIDLTIEGSTQVVRGQSVRWLVTAYEVVGLDRLRPAPGTRIDIATALEQEEDAPQFEMVETDRFGQALVTFEVPENAPAGFGVTISAHAPRGITRRYELSVSTTEYRRLTTYAAPGFHPGGFLPVFGRYERVDGRALPDENVSIQLSDSTGPLGPPVEATTNEHGVFYHRIRVPRRATGNVAVRVSSPEDEAHRRLVASASANAQTTSPPRLLLQARPVQAIVGPHADPVFELIVRRPDGRPVEGAVVSLNQHPVRMRAVDIPVREHGQYAITDGQGRATLTMSRRRTPISGIQDVGVHFHAGAEGIGTASTQTSVRVTDQQRAGVLRVEGGALAPGLRARLYVLAVNVDGSVATGQQVGLEGPGIGSLTATTSDQGIAVLEVEYDGSADDSRCGGRAAASIRLRIPGAQDQALCVPVDRDQSTRPWLVAPEQVHPGELVVQVQRRADVRQAPVLVTLHRSFGGQQLAPLAMAIASRRDREVTLQIPESFHSSGDPTDAAHSGEFYVRTRALVGVQQRPVRGALVRLFVGASRTGDTVAFPLEHWAEAQPPTVTQIGSREEIHIGLTHHTSQTSVALAVPATMAHFLGAASSWPEPFRVLLTNARSIRDGMAPYVIRDGRTIASPLPSQPRGILRDPWRASERFVTGRLGLIFRALEARVEAAVPGNIEDVATESRGRLQLNRDLLSSISGGALGSAGATGLGGEPLTIVQLESLDRAFSYDNMARRITRRRLFGLLLALRDFVRERGFDLPWARPGDPTLWLAPLNGRHVQGFGSIGARLLADGWGRPFELRRTSGRRTRLGSVQPVEGFEIVSAGPDGRFGNSDDLRDPTARVLPSGGVYAGAVGEDALVARLGGVELGRESARALAAAFGQHIAPMPAMRQDTVANVSLGSLPAVLPDHRFELALSRPGTAARSSSVRRSGVGSQELILHPGEEPRTWGVVLWSVDAFGRQSTHVEQVRAGSNVFTTAALPSRLRVDEPYASRVTITNVSRSEEVFRLHSEGERLRFEMPSELRVPAGQSRSFDIVLRATEAGRATFDIAIESGSGQGTDRRNMRGRVNVDRGLHPIRRVATGLSPFRSTLSVPSEAVDAHTRLVFIAPSALARDPELADLRDQRPELLAWSETLAGRELTPALRADLLRRQPSDLLGMATAVVSLSALFEEGRPDPTASARRRMLVSRLTGSTPMPDADPSAGRIRALAAGLAALATSGVPREGRDPVSSLLASWRLELRRALRTHPGDRSVLARASAALLLADPDDGHGRAMFTLAFEASETTGFGRTLSGSERRPGRNETLAATLSLAIAAHQLGRTGDARDLLRGAARYHTAIARNALGGGSAEATFWWLASGAYGAMGDSPAEVRVTINGDERQVSLVNGRAVLAIDGHETRVEFEDDSAVFVRLESVFGRAFAAGTSPVMALAIRGEVGRNGGQSGFELSVTAKTAISSPVIELQLPAGVEANNALLAVFARNPHVQSAQRRSPGFVRLRLRPLAEEVEALIALPVVWHAPSRVRGLGVVGYPASDPSMMAILAPRVLSPAE